MRVRVKGWRGRERGEGQMDEETNGRGLTSDHVTGAEVEGELASAHALRDEVPSFPPFAVPSF